MSHFAIRVRVAAAFAVAMAVVLTAAGLLVYIRLGADLNQALDQDLRLRAQDLAGLVRDPGNSLRAEASGRLVESGESFAKLLDGRGGVIDSSRSLDRIALLSPSQSARALRHNRFIDRPSAPGLDEPARLLAVRVKRGGRGVVLVVGATRENRAETLSSLRTELLIAGPAALVLATLVGYLLAGVGLRAVEKPARQRPAPRSRRGDARCPGGQRRGRAARPRSGRRPPARPMRP